MFIAALLHVAHLLLLLSPGGFSPSVIAFPPTAPTKPSKRKPDHSPSITKFGTKSHENPHQHPHSTTHLLAGATTGRRRQRARKHQGLQGSQRKLSLQQHSSVQWHLTDILTTSHGQLQAVTVRVSLFLGVVHLSKNRPCQLAVGD